MEQFKHDNPMKRQVWSLPELLLQQYENLEPKTRHLIRTPEIFSLRKIILTGCGDSYAAMLATKNAFEILTEIPVEVIPTIDVARYYPVGKGNTYPNTPLLIALSNSGNVARVAEAVTRVNHYHGFTIGVTGQLESMLGKAASRVLQLEIPDFESAPGVRSYMVSILALLLMAIRIGEVKGLYTMDQAGSYRSEIHKLADLLKESLNSMDAAIFETAQRWKAFSGFDFIGAGTDYASAWYGHAKILEATGKYSMHINTEEWLHLNYFLRDADRVGTVLVVDQNSPAFSRAVEVAQHIAAMGRPFMIVSNKKNSLFPEQSQFIPFPDGKYPWMSSLVSFTPLALLAGHLSDLLGEEYGRGATGRWNACQNGATTRESQIQIV